MHCLIFDLDGTLVDSEPLCNQAFLDLLPNLDDTVVGLMARYRGRRLANVLQDIAERLQGALPPEFEQHYRDRVAELYNARLTAMPGAVDMLAELPHARCVASNGPFEKMTHGLRITGLDRFFGDNIFSSYEIRRWKPDPHLFLWAAQRMGFAPSRCVVVEDSEAGLQAAATAGIPAIQYCPAGAPRSPLATESIGDLRELSGALENIARAA